MCKFLESCTARSDGPGKYRQMKRKTEARGYVDHSETFDEFLAKDGLLAETEESAIKEIIADQIKIAMDSQGD